MCSLHHKRAKNGVHPDKPLRRITRYNGEKCSVDGCQAPAKARFLCAVHYSRKLRGIQIDAPIVKRRMAPGERRLNSHGYVMLRLPDGSRAVREHSFVMEQHLGRPLRKHETVHHLNGDRTDNRIENLELWSRSHPPGQRVVDKIAWCREFLAQYSGDGY